jgi:hypothetical protein
MAILPDTVDPFARRLGEQKRAGRIRPRRRRRAETHGVALCLKLLKAI